MREPDIYAEGQPFWLRLPEDPMPEGGWYYLGTLVSSIEKTPRAEEVPEMQHMQPATSTMLLLPADALIAVSGQSELGDVRGLVPVVLTEHGPRPHIDKDGIIRIHVVTSTGCA
jgi:hypothetical protein